MLFKFLKISYVLLEVPNRNGGTAKIILPKNYTSYPILSATAQTPRNLSFTYLFSAL